MRDALFALAWIMMLPLSMASAHVGVMVWIWVAMLSPNELLYGFMAGLPFNKMIAIITLGIIVISNEKKDFYLDATAWMMLTFAAIATVSWLDPIVESTDGTALYEKLIKEIVLALVIMFVMGTRHRIHMTVIIIALSLGFFSVKEGILFLATAGGHKILGVGSVGDNNSIATAVLMIIPLIYYLYRYSSRKIIRAGFMVALVLSIATVIGTFSRGGFIGMLVLGLFWIKNSRNKLGSLILVLTTVALVYNLAPASWFERLSSINTAGEDASFMGRVVVWKMSLLIALDHPLFGGGPHAVQRLLVWDTYKPFLHLVDFVETPPPDVIPHAAHSIWFEVLGDYGFLGLGTFLALLVTAYWHCYSIQRMARKQESLAWASDLARMVQISLATYAVTGSALSMAYFELLYILLALLSRVRRTVRLSLLAQARLAGAGPASRPAPTGGVLTPAPAAHRPSPGSARGAAPARRSRFGAVPGGTS